MIGIEQLLRELGVRLCASPSVLRDNSYATYLALNLVFHAGTKNIELNFHFVRDGCLRPGPIAQYDKMVPGPRVTGWAGPVRILNMLARAW